MGIILITMLSLLSIFILSWHFIQLFVQKYKNLPPSPFTLPIIGHLHLLKEPLHETLTQMANRVGPVILLRLGRQTMVHISSTSAAEDCLRHNDAICGGRPRLLTGDILGYGCNTFVWSSYGSTAWKNYRRISSIEMFSHQQLQYSIGIRTEEMKSLIRQTLKDSADETVEIGVALLALTHDAVMGVLSRERYYGEEAKVFKRVMRAVMRTEGTTTLVDLFPWLNVFGIKKSLWKKFSVLAQEKDTFLGNLVEKNRRTMEEEEENGKVDVSMNRQKTLIEVMLSLQKKEPKFYTDNVIKGFLQVLLVAGTDTTAATIEWGMTLLLNNPHTLKKAQQEIDSYIGDERLVDETDLPNLPYLRCLVFETLRLFPPAPMLLPHETIEDCIIGGYNIPCGTTLMVNIWAIHRDPAHWADPESFKPERFEDLLDDGFDQLKYKYMPFGSGRRGCPGEGMALRMIGLALGSLIQCFDWERPGPELIDMRIDPGISIPRAQPLRAKCRPRQSMAQLFSQL